MKKYVSFLFISLCLMLLCPATAYADPVIRNVPKYQQPSDPSGLCWAACDKMIIQYLKNSSPSITTLKNNYGDPNDDYGADIDTARQALNDYDITNSLQENKLTWNGLCWQINNNRPIFARIRNGGGLILNHAVVIKGYNVENQLVIYNEPKDGLGHQTSYTNFCYYDKPLGYAGTWDGSIFDNQY